MPVTRGGGLRISTRTVGRLRVAERETIFWDRDLPGFGVRVYPSGTKTFVVQSRGEGRSRRPHHRAPRSDHRRRGEAPGGPDHRPHQVLGRSRAPRPLLRGHGGGVRRALSRGARRDPLQAGHAGPLPGRGPTVHRARRRGDPGLVRQPRAGRRPASLASQDTLRRQPGRSPPRPNPRRGRGRGASSARREPLPIHREVPGTPARALPLRGGAAAPRSSPGGGGDGRGRSLAGRRRGDPAPRPHRLPAERDPRPSLGARRPRGGRAAPPRQQDGGEAGAPLAGRRGGGGGAAEDPRQPVGDFGPQDGRPPPEPPVPLGDPPGAGGGSRTSASTTSATRSRRGRSPLGRACP